MEKIKKIIYDKIRESVKLELTGHLGKVVEEDDRLICYVKQNKNSKRYILTDIICKGIKDQELANSYNLNKKICYIFDNVDFNTFMLNIYGAPDCEIIIRNCNMINLGCLNISIGGNLTIENSNFKVVRSMSFGATDLNVNNVVINGESSFDADSNVIFSARNKINVTDTNVGKPTDDYVIFSGRVDIVELISSNEINIKNSKFYSKKCTTCEAISGSINADDESLLNSKNKVIVQGDNFNFININSPKLYLNGVDIELKDGKAKLSNDNYELIVKRIQLLSALKKVKNKIENSNFEKIEKHFNNLNNKPIGRVLKK